MEFAAEGKDAGVAGLAEGMGKLAVEEGFTAEEQGVFAEVKGRVLEARPDTHIDDRLLAVVTMLSKCRADKAVENYGSFLDTLAEYGLDSATLLDMDHEMEPLQRYVCGRVGCEVVPRCDSRVYGGEGEEARCLRARELYFRDVESKRGIQRHTSLLRFDGCVCVLWGL